MNYDPSHELVLLGFAGSLRAGSHNRALLRAAGELAPRGTTLKIHEIRDLPLYDADLDSDDPPAEVRRLKQAIAAADGILYACPEYNYGVPGPLKNAIDWASRPGYRSVLAHKPSMIIGASASAVGTARAQGQLKQVLLGVLSVVYPCPEYLLAGANQKFEAGKLKDDTSRKLLAERLEGFRDFTAGLKRLRQDGVWPASN